MHGTQISSTRKILSANNLRLTWTVEIVNLKFSYDFLWVEEGGGGEAAAMSLYDKITIVVIQYL